MQKKKEFDQKESTQITNIENKLELMTSVYYLPECEEAKSESGESHTWSRASSEPRMDVTRYEHAAGTSALDAHSSATPRRKSWSRASSERQLVNSSYQHDIDGHNYATSARKSWSRASSEPRMVVPRGYEEQEGQKSEVDVYRSAVSCGKLSPRTSSDSRIVNTRRYQHGETKSEVGGYLSAAPLRESWSFTPSLPGMAIARQNHQETRPTPASRSFGQAYDQHGERRPEINSRSSTATPTQDSWSCSASITSRDTILEDQAQWDFKLSATLPRHSLHYTQGQSMMNNRYENEEVASDFDLLVPPPSQACAHSPSPTKVRFGTVNVHTHDIALGDNPAVKTGLPLSLDWENIGSECFGVDAFEKMHEGRARKASRISKADREALLRSKGYSTACFEVVLREIQMIKDARRDVRQEFCRLKTVEKRLEKAAQMILQAKVASQIILEAEVAEVQFNVRRREARQMDIIYQNEPNANMQTAYRGEVQPETFSRDNYQAQGEYNAQILSTRNEWDDKQKSTRITEYRSREEYKARNTSFRVEKSRKEQPRKEECRSPSQSSVGRQKKKKGLCMEEYQKQIKSTRLVSRAK
jgi:hypothetical protein